MQEIDTCEVCGTALGSSGQEQTLPECPSCGAALAPSDPTRALPGRAARGISPVLLGHYRVESHLGSGSFGLVVKAEDVRNHRMVAVKLLTQQDAGALLRFDRE